MAAPLLIAKHGTDDLCLLPALANRHGLVTGATGTGKTVTLQAMAQRFSVIGVPVFMADDPAAATRRSTSASSSSACP